jgi:hypothetical protein
MAYSSGYNVGQIPNPQQTGAIIGLSEQEQDEENMKRQQALSDKLILEGVQPRQLGSRWAGFFGALGQAGTGLAGGMRLKQLLTEQKAMRQERLDNRRMYYDSLFGGGKQREPDLYRKDREQNISQVDGAIPGE